MELALERQAHAPWTVVRVTGELDLHTSPKLRDEVLELVAAGTDRLALDLSGVSFMDSSSLGVLVTCLKRIRERDGRLALVGVSGSPAKVLALTGLDRVFEISGSVDDLEAGT